MSAAIQTAKREVAVGVMNLLVADKARVDYLEHRPMKTATINSVDALMKALAAGIAIDCSESIVLIFHVGGLKDPSGNGYDGLGDTADMLKLPHFADAKKANPCSLVIFNADKPLSQQHASVVHTADHEGGNPLLFTHGHQGDPSLVHLHDLQPGFAGQTVLLSVASL